MRQMDLVLRSDLDVSESSNSFVENGIWNLTDVIMFRNVVNYGKQYGEYSEIIFILVLKRHPTFYILTIITPCLLLSIINLLVFILPTESGEKVSLGITNVLALVLFQQLISGIMPPTSDNSPLIGKFYFLIPCNSADCIQRTDFGLSNTLSTTAHFSR